MRHEDADYDQLLDLTRDLGATLIAGAVTPPMNGRMWVGDRTLDELLLPDGQPIMVTLLIAAGGAPQRTIAIGRGVLDETDRQRLEQLAATIGASLYHGQLAQLTPADWLALHPAPNQLSDSVAPGVGDGAHVHAGLPESGGAQDNALLERAQAQGWPSNLSNGPNLFLDDQPLYHLMAKENPGRDMVLLVARHANTS